MAILSSVPKGVAAPRRSEEHTSELQSLMSLPYAVFCLKKKKKNSQKTDEKNNINEKRHYKLYNDKLLHNYLKHTELHIRFTYQQTYQNKQYSMLNTSKHLIERDNTSTTQHCTRY